MRVGERERVGWYRRRVGWAEAGSIIVKSKNAIVRNNSIEQKVKIVDKAVSSNSEKISSNLSNLENKIQVSKGSIGQQSKPSSLERTSSQESPLILSIKNRYFLKSTLSSNPEPQWKARSPTSC